MQTALRNGGRPVTARPPDLGRRGMLGRSTTRAAHRLGAAPTAIVVLALACLLTAPPVSAWPGASPRERDRSPVPPSIVAYEPPVLAPVIDPFRAPPTPYGPGNRGIEYATVPGTPVVAAADGTVTFAGFVAGSLHVTVRHADGIRTSYSFLAAVRVRLDAQVTRGQTVGVAGARLHVGARRGDVYLDPASLWERSVAPLAVHLVALDGHDGAAGAVQAGRFQEDRGALLKLVAEARNQPLGSQLARSVRLAASQLLAPALAGPP